MDNGQLRFNFPCILMANFKHLMNFKNISLDKKLTLSLVVHFTKSLLKSYKIRLVAFALESGHSSGQPYLNLEVLVLSCQPIRVQSCNCLACEVINM